MTKIDGAWMHAGENHRYVRGIGVARDFQGREAGLLLLVPHRCPFHHETTHKLGVRNSAFAIGAIRQENRPPLSQGRRWVALPGC